MDLLKEFPFVVTYPSAGDVKLLLWHAQNEGNNLLMAKSDEGLERLFARVLKKRRGDADAVKIYDATLVAPPLELRKERAESLLQTAYSEFTIQFVTGLKECQERHKLPEGVRLCTEYKAYPEDTDPPNEYELKNHWSCANCLDGFVITGRSILDLFIAKRSEVEYLRLTRFAPGKPPKKQRVMKHVSVAPEAVNAGEKPSVFIVDESFGDHSQGVDIKPAKYAGSSTMFFFQGSARKPTAEMKKMSKVYEDQYAKEEAERKKDFKKDRLQLEGMHMSIVKAVLA